VSQPDPRLGDEISGEPAISTGLLVLNPGLETTVQDGGRPGYRAFGVPLGGAFDRGALAVANRLLGNPPDAAALELTLIGGAYQARSPLRMALAGAPMPARIEPARGLSRGLFPPQAFHLEAEDRLVLGTAEQGTRAYLAVRGGWQTELVLGSRSSEHPLHAGDLIPAEASGPGPERRIRPAPLGDPEEQPIRILDGPDTNPNVSPGFWESASYRISSRSNRMGLRLEGPAPPVAVAAERLSTPVAPGTIQVVQGGLIVLGVACGTMGGYPQIGQVISADLDRLAQARPGTSLRFRTVDLADARRIDADARRERADWGLRMVWAILGHVPEG
jgi:biotin-dependent carboxylase-like uncharacterized protein